MLRSLLRAFFLVSTLFWAACASRPLPKYEQPLARAAVQRVRTTAYTHTESDHRRYAAQTALGTPLRSGAIKSAAADWSRWPSGTLFRIVETGEIREVDDYGWALSGTNTIDLYQPTRAGMNAWGVRRVNIEILRWGDVWQSHAVLRPRAQFAHVRRMLKQIEGRYSRSHPAEAPVIAANTQTPEPPLALSPESAPPPPSSAVPVKRAEMVSANGAKLRPFYQ